MDCRALTSVLNPLLVLRAAVFAEVYLLVVVSVGLGAETRDPVRYSFFRTFPAFAPITCKIFLTYTLPRPYIQLISPTDPIPNTISPSPPKPTLTNTAPIPIHLISPTPPGAQPVDRHNTGRTEQTLILIDIPIPGQALFSEDTAAGALVALAG